MIQLRSGEWIDTEAVARIRFATTSEGGRRGGLHGSSGFYSCPLFVDGVSHGFDVRLFFPATGIELGDTSEVELIFLSAETAREHFTPGREFRIWEGRPVGAGTILSTNWARQRSAQSSE